MARSPSAWSQLSNTWMASVDLPEIDGLNHQEPAGHRIHAAGHRRVRAHRVDPVKQVAPDDAGLVRGLQRLGNLAGEPRCLSTFPPPWPESRELYASEPTDLVSNPSIRPT